MKDVSLRECLQRGRCSQSQRILNHIVLSSPCITATAAGRCHVLRNGRRTPAATAEADEASTPKLKAHSVDGCAPVRWLTCRLFRENDGTTRASFIGEPRLCFGFRCFPASRDLCPASTEAHCMADSVAAAETCAGNCGQRS